MTDNNGMGYNMNLVPQGYGNGYGNDGGMFGGNWMWFLLVWMAMFGWGNGGMFGGGNHGGGYIVNDVQRGFDQQAIMTGISGVQNAVNGIVPALQNGFAQAEIAANGRQMADMQQNFQMQSAMQQCCCDQRAGIADLKYTIAQGNRDVMDNDNRNHQAEMDKLCQLELDGYKQQLAQANRTIDNLNTQLLVAQGRASQSDQTATIQAGQRALANEIEQYVVPTARPAYIVQNPNCCPQYNYGCHGMAA